ncbi:MAG TPA: histidine ammonia-lyase [Pirellulaceae bacterium]|nr:histidine ammonia-lyase [Pirellulaceae bacterium]
MIAISREISFSTIEAALQGPIRIELDAPAAGAIEKGQQALIEILRNQQTVYGINTGFGLLAEKRISSQDLNQLQINLVLSHACGIGTPLEPRIVRLVLLLKIKSLSIGYSGVRLELVQRLAALLNADALPEIPSQGSVGASGDLAPLAHLASALIGEGFIWIGGKRLTAAAALNQIGLSPFALGPKEGIALLNGTQVSTALALAGLCDARRVFSAAIVAGAMSVDAAMGTDAPFDPRIHHVRPYLGQQRCAALLRRLLTGSQIRESHRGCARVQDPYSLRCQPQVMGAVWDQMAYAARQLLCEANSVTDNPLLFPDTGDSLSGGNFHAQPVAFAADALAVAICEIGSLSERRIALLIDRHLSQLPPFLVEHGGLHSGFMIPQVAAAALVSENKSLAYPSSVDSLPTSANQEDHVSMATYAARRTIEMARNAGAVVAIELLAAAQGIDFRRPLLTSPPLQAALQRIRSEVPFYDKDRFFSPDIERIRQLVATGAWEDIAEVPWT